MRTERNMRRQKRKSPFYKKWWFWLIIIIFVIGGIDNIINPEKTVSSDAKQSQVKNVEKKKQSSKKIVTPAKKTTSNKSTHKKSTSKTTEPVKKISKAKQNIENNKTDNNQKSTQDEQQHDQSMLKSYANSFGMKDAETVQKMVGSAYSSQYIDGQGMTYAWATQYGTLMRVDDTNNKITTVYLYNKDTQSMGEVLYQGQTILQKAPRQYYFYN